MFDHLTLRVTHYDATKTAYLAALAPLGFAQVMELTPEQVPDLPGRCLGMGVGGKPELWLLEVPGPVTATHLALRAENRAQVDAFHAAAIEAGLTDHGAPGVRPHYHPNYYGAFVLDADGYNLEAVCHAPE